MATAANPANTSNPGPALAKDFNPPAIPLKKPPIDFPAPLAALPTLSVLPVKLVIFSVTFDIGPPSFEIPPPSLLNTADIPLPAKDIKGLISWVDSMRPIPISRGPIVPKPFENFIS